MRRLVQAALLIGSLAAPPAAMAFPASTSGFVGAWTAIDCPSDGATIDCSIPWGHDDEGNPVYGDGSLQKLRIGRGLAPPVTYEDTYASVCDNAGSQSTRWLAAGSGEYAPPFEFLWANFSKSGCGSFGKGGYSIHLYHDPGSDTIWEDTDGDGLGTLWTRAR